VEQAFLPLQRWYVAQNKRQAGMPVLPPAQNDGFFNNLLVFLNHQNKLGNWMTKRKKFENQFRSESF
jgi:hypothetical protein